MAERVSGFIFLLLSFPAMVFAQFTTPSRSSLDPPSFSQTNLHGQIANPSEAVLVGVSVELCERTGHVISRAQVTASGEFYFESVPSGYYILRVLDSSGYIVTEQLVEPPNNASGDILIKLPEKKGDRPASGSVSLAELQHKVPPKALKEAEKADKAVHKNDLPAVIVHLEKALEIDPEFFAARRNLAKALIMTGQNEKAIPVLQQLLQTEPRSVLAYDGLGTVYLTSRRFADAEAAARKALEIDGSNELGHWVLGCSLTALGKADAEALKHLTTIVKRFPRAYIVAAGILARQGHKEEAKKQLLAYLNTGDTGARTQAEEALHEIR
jgi:tetratricopeptide (TPR) repeat protein